MEKLISVTDDEYLAAHTYATRRTLAEKGLEGEEGHSYTDFASRMTARSLEALKAMQKKREETE